MWCTYIFRILKSYAKFSFHACFILCFMYEPMQFMPYAIILPARWVREIGASSERDHKIEIPLSSLSGVGPTRTVTGYSSFRRPSQARYYNRSTLSPLPNGFLTEPLRIASVTCLQVNLTPFAPLRHTFQHPLSLPG